MRRGYYAAIGYMDYHFGLVLEALEETKAANDTCATLSAMPCVIRSADSVQSLTPGRVACLVSVVIAWGDHVSRPFSSWNRPILTEIYLCHACSCHEIEGGNGRTGMVARGA
jgi:hypothetical protein